MRGLITDRRAKRDELPLEDPLKASKWNDAYSLFDKVQKLVPEMNISWEAFAIKFCLAHPMVATVVMGLNNPAQVDAAVTAADGNYPDRDLLKKVYDTIAANRPERNTWI